MKFTRDTVTDANSFSTIELNSMKSLATRRSAQPRRGASNP